MIAADVMYRNYNLSFRVQSGATLSPLTVLQKILLGALKWYGPREGLVFILLRRKARYFTVERHAMHINQLQWYTRWWYPVLHFIMLMSQMVVHVKSSHGLLNSNNSDKLTSLTTSMLKGWQFYLILLTTYACCGKSCRRCWYLHISPQPPCVLKRYTLLHHTTSSH